MRQVCYPYSEAHAPARGLWSFCREWSCQRTPNVAFGGAFCSCGSAGEPCEHPAEAIFLDDATLLCLYSHRHEPFGVRGKISHDAGRSWREDLVLLIDDTWLHADCGYPTVEIVGGEELLIARYVNDDQSTELQRDRQCRTLRVNLGALRSQLGSNKQVCPPRLRFPG